eukprot:510761-Pelagomonas_calceolata.AAC.3
MQDFAQWFPQLLDLYFEGSITCSNLSRASFKRLEHMDLINTLPTPFQNAISCLYDMLLVHTAGQFCPAPPPPDVPGHAECCARTPWAGEAAFRQALLCVPQQQKRCCSQAPV